MYNKALLLLFLIFLHNIEGNAITQQGPVQNYRVAVTNESNNPVKNTIVTVNGRSYRTDVNGVFRLEKTEITYDPSAWNIKGYQSFRFTVDVNGDEKIITVIVENLDIPNQATSLRDSIQDDDQSEKYNVAQLDNDIEKLEQLYSEKGDEFRLQNKRILNITDSLSNITVLTAVQKRKIIAQIDELNKAMESTAKEFDEINSNSLELIKVLTTKLDKKDQTIKNIEEEKNALITTLRDNLTVFIAIVISILLLLLIALFIIKRFNTQNKLIQRTKKQLINAQEIAKIGSMVYDFKNQYFTYSQNFFDTLRISNDERINGLQRKSEGVIFNDLINEDDRKRVADSWENGLMTHESFSIEFKGQADDEKNIYIEMRTKFDKDTSGNVISISSTLQDISEKKESEFLLLEAMRKTEEASRIKEEFLSAMSHEIRNPLNAIIGLSEHLISQDPKESQLKNLATIQFSSQHLLSLVNDVLDFSKIRAGKVKIETHDIDIRNLVQGVVSTMEFNAKEAGIKLIFRFDDSVPNYVIGDELRINQILTNLIGNAIKFTNNGSVTLSISIEKSKNKISEINFNVKDTGIGIAKDKLKKIFESFEQENDSTTREYGGTGLGLAISKQLVSLMGGRQLEVKSTVGVGSEFYFSVPFKNSSLPRSTENGKQNSNHEIDSGSMSGIKVLCVEDNEINIMVISQYFKKWEIKATYAQTGQEALEAYKKESFDLVFMDIRLPDMKGYEVAKAICLEYPDQKTPIIALTAELDKQTEQKIFDAGMVDFLSKPFKSEDLSRLIITYAIHNKPSAT